MSYIHWLNSSWFSWPQFYSWPPTRKKIHDPTWPMEKQTKPRNFIYYFVINDLWSWYFSSYLPDKWRIMLCVTFSWIRWKTSPDFLIRWTQIVKSFSDLLNKKCGTIYQFIKNIICIRIIVKNHLLLSDGNPITKTMPIWLTQK